MEFPVLVQDHDMGGVVSGRHGLGTHGLGQRARSQKHGPHQQT